MIDKATNPTSWPWVNSMETTVKPNGMLRIYFDPRDLNNAINCDYYPTQTIEHVFTRMPNAVYQIFSLGC